MRNWKSRVTLAMLGCVILAGGCQKEDNQSASKKATKSEPEKKKVEPDYITVQHILVGFKGSVPGKDITRSHEEAQERAEELLKRAQEGEDFDSLVKEFTDDSHPGIYKMANFGIPGDMSGKDASKYVYPREGMVPAFGDVGFPLEVGEIGMSAHDTIKSKYGWHIIKRIK